jgi:hypothetical protein
MSVVRVGTIQDGSGKQVYPAKSWVNFNGTGVIAIRASGNASSLTDSNIGAYSVNFATAISDVNYSYGHAYSNEVSTQHTVGFWGGQATTFCAVVHYNAANSANVVDKSYVYMIVHR